MPNRFFDLRLDKANDGSYSVEVVDSPLARSDHYSLDLPKDRIGDWRAWLRSREFDRRYAEELGKALFAALFPDSIRVLWERCDAYVGQGDMLRLRLDIRSPELISVPWELLHTGGIHLAMSRRWPIVRYSRAQMMGAPKVLNTPLNILIAVSLPPDAPSLPAAETEIRQICESLGGLSDERKDGRIQVLRPATLTGLRRRLHEDYHVLHFIGHGAFADNKGYLVLQDDAGAARAVDGETLGYQLLDSSLRLLVLSACMTAIPSETGPMLGVAQAALTVGIPAVVAMQGALRDDAGPAFARAFYEQLAEGCSLESCMVESRKELIDSAGLDQPDWAMPVLFSSVERGTLWHVTGNPRIAGTERPASQPISSRPIMRDAGPVIAPVEPVVLHNLTAADFPAFVDRQEAHEQIMRALGAQSAASVITITGVNGVGRSALAHQVASDWLALSSHNPSDPSAFRGIVRVSAQHAALTPQGTIRPAIGLWSLDDLYLAICKTLRKQNLLQARPEERPALLQDLLREARYLLILTNVDDVPDPRVKGLLQNLPLPSKAILTSRSALDIGGLVVPLAGLDSESALRLLREDAQARQVTAIHQADEASLLSLFDQTDGLPLVLRWVVSQLRDSGQPLPWVMERLSQAGSQSLVEYCLQQTVHDLLPPQRRLLLSYALFPQAVRPEVVGEAADVRGDRLAEAQARLSQLQLVKPGETEGCYRIAMLARRYSLLELDADQSFSVSMVARLTRPGLMDLRPKPT